jgi:hypothetical protein
MGSDLQGFGTTLVLSIVFLASLISPETILARAPGNQVADPCPAVAIDPNIAPSAITANCLPKMTAAWSAPEASATMKLEPVLDLPLQPLPPAGSGYSVFFVSVTGTWNAQVETTTVNGGPDCQASASGNTAGWYVGGFDGTGGWGSGLGADMATPNEVCPGVTTWIGPPLSLNGKIYGSAFIQFSPPPPYCFPPSEGGSLSSGPLVRYNGACTVSLSPVTAPSGSAQFRVVASYNEPPCQRRGTLTGEAYAKLDASLKAGLSRLYRMLDANGGCYVFTSGYRDQKQIWDRWHHIADQHCRSPFPSLSAVNAQLQSDGFAQQANGCGGVGTDGRSHSDVATGDNGGPCNPYVNYQCPHVGGIAADISWWWRPFGSLPFKYKKGQFVKIFLPRMKELAAKAGLCGPPTKDSVHFEVPVPQQKGPPKCRAWTRY